MALRRNEHTEGSCEFEGCDHPDAQYEVAVQLVALDGKQVALSCRRHVALVAKALAEEMRETVRRGVELSEMGELDDRRARGVIDDTG